MNRYFLVLTCLALLCLHSGTAPAADSGTFVSLTDVGPYETPSRYASGTITYNLGPTGARGWIKAYDGGGLFWGENGGEILVTHVYAGSPADGKLEVFDVLVGAGGRMFDKDADVSLGAAIARAQRGDGTLSLRRWRNGRTRKVILELPRLPGDSLDAPIVAEHSEALREQFLAFVAGSMHPDGFQMHSVYASLNALFLLANRQPEHLDHVRRHIHHVVDTMAGPDSDYGPWNWVKGSDTTLLAEYFLATGDTFVLPAIKQNLEWMRNSQSYAGGFGHGGPYGGYGHVGLPGMFCAIGATLARECGVTGYDDVIDSAECFYGRAAGLGKVGYGGFDAGLGLKTLYGDNGKSGTAAVLYGCLGDRQTSQAYASTACALAPYSQSGHSGHFWSFSWGAIGANRAELPYRKYFARELDWYYALARTWRGGMTAQPWLASMGSYAPGGAELATGGMALRYCTPLKSLRILGGKESVLSQDLTPPLAKARKLICENNYTECLAVLDRFTPASDREREQAEQLRTIAGRGLKTINLTLASIQSNIDNGDLFTAERQLRALQPILRETGRTERFAALMQTEDNAAIVAAGRAYYDAMKRRASPDREFFFRAPTIVFDARQRARMQEIADSAESGVYAAMAASALERWQPETAATDFKALVDQEATMAGPYRMYLSPDADSEQGVRYRYYEFDKIPNLVGDVRDMKPVEEGTIQGLDLSARKRDQNFAFVFTTFVEVDKAAKYEFTLTSDDGSELYVNGEKLIDNGGLHGTISETGTVRLPSGRHELECIMFQGRGGYGLRVEMTALAPPDPGKTREISFQVEDPASVQKLKLRVKASDPVGVELNGQVICRFHKKRKKHMFDGSWKEWEEVTLRPEALQLLRQGDNLLGVMAKSHQLSPDGVRIGVQFQGARATPPLSPHP